MIGRIILKLMETAIMDINTNSLRILEDFSKMVTKSTLNSIFFFCKKYCNSFLEKKYCNNSILYFLNSIAILEKSIAILHY